MTAAGMAMKVSVPQEQRDIMKIATPIARYVSRRSWQAGHPSDEFSGGEFSVAELMRLRYWSRGKSSTRCNRNCAAGHSLQCCPALPRARAASSHAHDYEHFLSSHEANPSPRSEGPAVVQVYIELPGRKARQPLTRAAPSSIFKFPLGQRGTQHIAGSFRNPRGKPLIPGQSPSRGEWRRIVEVLMPNGNS